MKKTYQESPQERGTPRWWMAKGFKVIIRCCRVFLWKPGSNYVAVTAVDNGRWMEQPETLKAPWKLVTLTENQRANFDATARDCYCGQCGIERCDFCTSTRTPDGAPGSSGKDFWNENA